ncbi:hypothetical protein [Brachyspira sp.]|uniref:hypothetical protein n=1 Tax=Brachyspira sp. TaxID=1977261 RepID=UPI003D7DB4BE
MSEIFLYIIIAIIWAIIALINQANKKQTGKQKKSTKQVVVKKYQQDKLEDEEILKNLNETLNKNLNNTLNRERTIEKPQINKIEKFKEVVEEVKENKNYEISYKDMEMLELQKKYNSIIDNKNNIENINFENFSFDKKASNVSNIISSLDIKKAIIYNAILEPKRINYKKLK